MQWLQGAWAQRFNRYRGIKGRPFQGRFFGKPLEPGHVVAQVAHYVHLNPVEAGLVPVERVGEYRWSSLAAFPCRDRPAWVEPATVLGESGRLSDTAKGWRQYRDYLGVLWEKDPVMREKRFAKLCCAWAVGSPAYRAELRSRLQGRRESLSSVSRSWLAQRLQMGAPASLGPWLHRFRTSGALDHRPFRLQYPESYHDPFWGLESYHDPFWGLAYSRAAD